MACLLVPDLLLPALRSPAAATARDAPGHAQGQEEQPTSTDGPGSSAAAPAAHHEQADDASQASGLTQEGCAEAVGGAAEAASQLRGGGTAGAAAAATASTAATAVPAISRASPPPAWPTAMRLQAPSTVGRGCNS